MAWTDQSKSLADGTQLQLRRARTQDAKHISRFRQALHNNALHLNAAPDEAHQSSWQIKRLLKQIGPHDSALYLLAWADDGLVGELQMRGSHYARLSHDIRLAVGVLPAAQGRGIGKTLLQHGAEWAKSIPSLKRISLSVHADNAAALHLYTQVGFVKEGVRRGAILPSTGHLAKEAIDEVLMALYL